jgi:hypothetical protein
MLMSSFVDRDVTFHLAIFVLIAIAPMDFWILIVSYLPSVDKDRIAFGGLDLLSLDFGHGHIVLVWRMATWPWIDERQWNPPK